jgi:glycosyltransferase involved in cell wall biosynthesis
MKVSFVVPIYKKAQPTVRKCLKSLFQQSHKDIEVVCVFDGPDPDMETMVKKEFPSANVLVIPHGGAPKARNAGFKASTGEIISFWDADCFAESRRVVHGWVFAFEKHPEMDFIYAGYKFTDPKLPGFMSEAFDPWTLRKYNYISTMFPVRREKVVEWDEALAGLQDWDFWRRVTDAGGRGYWQGEGYGFSTEPPDKDAISMHSSQERITRIEAVRKKHGDAESEILVVSGAYKRDAIELAKILDADYFWSPYWITRKYKTIASIGLFPQDLSGLAPFFESASDASTRRVIYWMGYDAETMFHSPFNEVKAMVEMLNKTIEKQYCADERTKDFLEQIGISAEVLPLPVKAGKVFNTLPEKFRVLAFYDQTHQLLIDSVIKAVPDILIDRMEYGKPFPLEQYSAVMQFLVNKRLDAATVKALIQGRRVISNVQAPFAGYVDTSGGTTEIKAEVIAKLREYEPMKDIHAEAQEYYLELCAPEKFKAAFLRNKPIAMEAVGAAS